MFLIFNLAEPFQITRRRFSVDLLHEFGKWASLTYRDLARRIEIGDRLIELLTQCGELLRRCLQIGAQTFQLTDREMQLLDAHAGVLVRAMRLGQLVRFMLKCLA